MSFDACMSSLTTSLASPLPPPQLHRVNSTDVHLLLWDTAGQEEYDSITKAYYRGAQACVLVFSTTDRDSFMAVEEWKRKVGCVTSVSWRGVGVVLVRGGCGACKGWVWCM